jgi:hypothetical protein
MNKYIRNYIKGVKVRYREDYKGSPYIITRDRAQVDIIRRNYKGKYTIARPDQQTFIIWLEEVI